MSTDLHDSDSTEQQQAQDEILTGLRQILGLRFADTPDIDPAVSLDGYQGGENPACVEVFAHVGSPKSGQRRKLMMDMCKMLLVERCLGRPCRKILAVCDEDAVAFLRGKGWPAAFAKEFGIDIQVLNVSPETVERLRETQKRQYR